MMSIHLQTNNRNSVRQAFAGAVAELPWRGNRDHHLMILSCYVDFTAIRRLINSIRGAANLTSVYLAFEYFEVFRGRQPNEILSELENLRQYCGRHNIDFEWEVICVGALMHAKSYAVIQFERAGGNLSGGVVCVGSGNATSPGLGSALRTNVELAYLSNEYGDLREFLEVWGRLMEGRRNLDDALLRFDAYEFAYSLLARGVFLHDWRNNLTSQICIKYTLTPEGRRAIAVNDELRLLGFDIDHATINRNPLNLEIDARILPPQFAGTYTIDTLLGRWCPMSIWNVVEETVRHDQQFQDFLVIFRKATRPLALKEIAENERQIAERLVARGFVTEAPDRIDSWVEKIRTLRDSEDRLARIFLRFTPFDLPYDYSARKQIIELRDSLFESLDIRVNMTFVARKIQAAEQEGDLSLLELSDEERTVLENLLRLRALA